VEAAAAVPAAPVAMPPQSVSFGKEIVYGIRPNAPPVEEVLPPSGVFWVEWGIEQLMFQGVILEGGYFLTAVG